METKDQSDLVVRQQTEILHLENELKVAKERVRQLCEELRKILEQ